MISVYLRELSMFYFICIEFSFIIYFKIMRIILFYFVYINLLIKFFLKICYKLFIIIILLNYKKYS